MHQRGVGLILLVTHGDAGVGLRVGCRVEEILRVVGRRSCQFPPPAGVGSRLVAVFGLELRHFERRGEGRLVGERNLGPAGLSLLGGDHDHAVCGARSVKRRRRGAGEHGHGFDVVRVEVRETLAAGLRLEFALYFAVVIVEEGNAVHHVEGVVAAADGFQTAKHHACGAADARCRRIDDRTCDFTVQRIHQIDVLHDADILRTHLLGVVAECLFRALDAEGRYDHGVYGLRLFVQREIDLRAIPHGDLYGAEAQIIDDQHGVPGRRGYLQRIVSAGSGARADGRSLDDDGRSDDRVALCVENLAGNRSGLCAHLFADRREHDIRSVDAIGHVGSFDHLRQCGLDGGVRAGDADFLGNVHVRVDGEKITGLFFDGVDHLFHRNVRHRDRDPGRSRLGKNRDG